MFDGDDLKKFINQATYVTVNDYEWQLMQERTKLSPHEVSERVEALIITRGPEPVLIYTRDKRHEVEVSKPKQIADPTGCGDAFRAGLLYGLMNDFDWETIGHIASLMGTIKIEHPGTQNHYFSKDEFADRFKKNYGYSF